MLFDTNRNKGRAGVSMAIAYYGSNGYTVLLPLDDTQDYDLVVEKDNVFQKVQVKSTGQKTSSGRYSVSVKSSGGTNGGIYARVLDSSADLLFILTEDKKLYEYKVCDITQRSSIVLQDAYEVFL